MSHEVSSKAPLLNYETFNIASAALRDAWTDFVLSRQAMQCTPKTMAGYAWSLGKFIAWLEEQGVAAPDQVGARHVRMYLAGFADRKSHTLHTLAGHIRTLLRFWHKEGYMTEAVSFEMPKVRQERLPFLDAEQVRRLLSVCDAREKALVLFMVDSGLRRQEVCNLNRQDVDMHSGAVIVRQGKGRKDRLAVIGATARRALLAYWRSQPYQEDDAPLFQTESGGRFTGCGLRSLFSRLSKRVGFKVGAHMLRRSFATLSLKNGMDIVSLQTLLGHTNLMTTRRYIQWLDADLLQAHRMASPGDHL